MPSHVQLVEHEIELMSSYCPFAIGHLLIERMASSFSKRLLLGLKSNYFFQMVSLTGLGQTNLEEKFGPAFNHYRTITADTLQKNKSRLLCFEKVFAGGNDWFFTIDVVRVNLFREYMLTNFIQKFKCCAFQPT